MTYITKCEYNTMLPDFKIVLRPNNQVTITRQNVIKRRDRYESLPENMSLGKKAINTYVNGRADRENLKTFYSKALRHDCLDQPHGNNAPLPPLPLDLINRFQRAKNITKELKRGYGKTPQIKYFSHKAGQKVRETGSIIDRFCGTQVERCRVVTLTIPSSEVSAFEAISNYSAYATNRLFQVIRRDYQLAYYFYVWEHQKRGALHLHICVYHEDPDISKEIGEKLCSKWVDILEDISEKTGIDMLFAKGFGRKCKPHEMQLDNQAMRLGCGAYFSKYASKNSGKYRDDINSINARKYPPSSFWGRSRELAKECERQAFKFAFEGDTDSYADELENEALEILSHAKIAYSHSFGFQKEIELSDEYGGGMLTICEGYTKVFYVSPMDYGELLAHFRYLYSDRRTSAIRERSKVSQSMVNMFCPNPPENEIF